MHSDHKKADRQAVLSVGLRDRESMGERERERKKKEIITEDREKCFARHMEDG